MCGRLKSGSVDQERGAITEIWKISGKKDLSMLVYLSTVYPRAGNPAPVICKYTADLVDIDFFKTIFPSDLVYFMGYGKCLLADDKGIEICPGC
jgi:hypothetical protein